MKPSPQFSEIGWREITKYQLSLVLDWNKIQILPYHSAGLFL